MLRNADKRLALGKVSDAFPLAGSSYRRRVLADTPKGFWMLQDASGAPIDSSGNGTDMTALAQIAVTGPPSPCYREPGPHALGRYAPGAGPDYGIWFPSCGYRRTLVSTVVNNFSLEIWLWYTGALVDSAVIMGNSQRSVASVGGADGWDLLWSGTAGKFMLGFGNVANLAASAATLSANTWNHIVVCRDAGTSKYYVNGALDTSNAGTSTPLTPTTGASGGTKFGSSTITQKLAYAALYESALSLAQVQAHYGAALG
jgi:hypothetical protein